MPDRVYVAPYAAQEVVEQSGRVYSLGAILAGVAIVLGGRGRWAAHDYDTALLIPGAPESWGYTLTTLGALMLFGLMRGHRKLVMTASWGCALWCWFFAVSVTVEVIQNPGVGYLGPVMWGTFGTLFIFRAMLHRKVFQ